MSTILEKIVQTKREEIAERRLRVPIEQLKEQVAALGRPRNFFHAITHRSDPRDEADRRSEEGIAKRRRDSR